MVNSVDLSALPGELLVWFGGAARRLPWRVMPDDRARGERPDPYRVWLSEIMLQQTTIAHATRYWLEFTRRWPDVEALARARDEEVMGAWAGLGYYARARNLLKCARAVTEAGGRFPQSRAQLQKLPGIGPYTSGAIAAIAFGERAAAVDGNVERVFARLLALEGDWAGAKKQIRSEVEALVPPDRPGEFAEALMDLGATVCTPKSPACGACPISTPCRARAGGTPERYPVKPKKAAKKELVASALVELAGGQVRLEQRPDSGLLGGMLGLPTSDWVEAGRDWPAPPGGHGEGAQRVGEIRHVFTHIDLQLAVFVVETTSGTDGDWRPVEAARAALPSVFRKALDLAKGTK
jgi:A/G-specific adenine glycosylase